MDLEIRNKRFLSLDVFRGIAILGVVVVHALIFGVFSTIDTALNILPLPMLIILSPVVIFAPMAGLFVFISSMSNGMVVQKRLYSIQTAIQPILITGLALLILHFIFPLLFNHSNTSMFHPDTMIDAMIPASITQGRLILPRFENLLLMDAMAMISMACFFFVIVSLILFRKNSKSTVEQKMFRLAVVGFRFVFCRKNSPDYDHRAVCDFRHMVCAVSVHRSRVLRFEAADAPYGVADGDFYVDLRRV